MIIEEATVLVLRCSGCRQIYGGDPETEGTIYHFANREEVERCFPPDVEWGPSGWRRDGEQILCRECSPLTDASVRDYGIPARWLNALLREELFTRGDVAKWDADYGLITVRGLGGKGVAEVRESMNLKEPTWQTRERPSLSRMYNHGAEAVRLRATGLTNAEIGAYFGVTAETVSRWVNEYQREIA